MTTNATEAEFEPLVALDIGIKAITGNAQQDEINRDYHEGRHPRLEWITKIKKVFGESVADQVHQMNYCELAIEKPLARMAVEGFEDPTADELFKANHLNLTQRDLYSDAMIVRQGFVVVAESVEEGPDAPPYDIVVQRAEDCYVEMGSLKPDDRDFGVKVTADPNLGDEGGYRAWVWDRENYWRYIADVGNPDEKPIPKASEFQPDPEDPEGPHGFDRVPLIPFRLGRDPRSRLDSLRPVQDRIDMLEIQKVIAGLFGASRQRVFFTTQELSAEDTEASPDFAIVLDPGNAEDGEAKVSEFEHTPLENFDGGIDAEIDRFYEIASLPKTGRMNVSTAASGESKKADEGEFVEMIRGYTDSFTESWREVFTLLGIDSEVVWKSPVTRDEQREMETVKVAVDAGVPLIFALKKWVGLDDDEETELLKAIAEQQAQEAEAREAALKAMDQGREAGVVRAEEFE